MASRLSRGVFLGFLGLVGACAADDSDLGGGGGTAGFGGGVGGAGGGKGGSGGSGGATGGSGGSGGATGGSGGSTGGSGGSTGGSGGSTGGSGGSTGGSGGSTGGSGGSTGGSGGSTGGSGGSTGGSGGSTGGSGGSGGSGDTAPPTVTATTPAPTTTGVSKSAIITVTFSEAMQVASITASTSGASCTGTIQVSSDNFATCAAMVANPVGSAGNTVFTLTPSGGLASLGAYKVRVTTGAKDAAGNALAAAYTASDAFTVRYFHTITIDGNNDFTANETFTSSSAGYVGYLAWDDGYLYIGMSGADVSSGSSQKWFAAYLSGTPGSTSGVTYNTQQPTLPFAARWHLRWRATNDLTNTQLWSGSSWGDAGWNFAGDVYKTGSFVEIRVPLVDIGSPTTLGVHLGMLNEQASVEGTYAAVPATSYAPGYDPNYAKYLELAIGGSVAPNASPIKP
jgi:hypothetical protein